MFIMEGSGLTQLLTTLAFLTTATGITLTGSSTSALVGQRVQFTCTVTGLSISQLLSFHRNSGSVCTIELNSCQQLRATSGYSCSCGQNGVYHMDITSVSAADDGTWACSQTSNNVTLTVYYGPFNNVTVDKASPLAVTENLNVPLTARCSAVCNPDCSYTWMKGTQQVSDNRDLPIGSFRRGQEGEYICTARNTATGATADSQTLTVNVQWYPSPPTHNCPSWIVPGQTTSCTCQTSDRGNPAGTVHWISPGGQTISSSGSSSVQLNLTSIPRSDNGLTYICRANNSLPSSNSDVTYVASIAYLDKPNIILDKNDVNENDTVNIVCTVESNPPAKITIDVNGRQETQTASNNLKRSTVKVWCSHNGTVTCKAENNRTKNVSSSTAQLNVKCPPREDLSMPRTSVVPGKPMTFVSLTAYVIANPLPQFTWYKHSTVRILVPNGTDSLIVSSGLSSTLRVHIKSEEDFTTYSVVVENNIGNTDVVFSLTKDVVSVSPLEAPCNIVPVAAGMGAVIVVLIVVVVVNLYRRRLCQGTGLPERNIDDGDGKTTMGLQRSAVREEISEHRRAEDGPLTAETDTYSNAYSGVYEMETDKQTYTELKELETTNGSSTQGNATYEGLQARAPQVYEDMRK
ncbi:hemicentin-2-like [Haliotis rubra]|uniref:hemicentin-2-like n=1 Tax=Haliotis rubra TaxID=36100 RepID=UPI001EE4F357|nr:hemicentin-2-like [Haliotis rubra]